MLNKYITIILFVTFVCSVFIVFGSAIFNQPKYAVPIVTGMTLLLYIAFNGNMQEDMTSDEAIQTVASVYNKDEMTVKNLNVTGKITTAGDVTVGGKLKLPSWTINSTDGHMRFEQNGSKGQQYVVHKEENGGAWSKNIGWHHALATKAQINDANNNINSIKSNYVPYNSNIKIHGNSGQLNNFGLRCNKGDRDRDIGISCQHGI